MRHAGFITTVFTVITGITVMFLLVCSPVLADEATIALSKESEAAAAASASTKPTPEMIKAKVNAACTMLSKEGVAGFAKLQGKDSEYIFAGTYIWVHDLKGVMRMHPIKYKLNGKNLTAFKDANGKRFFNVMNKVAKEKGSGWVDYMWPKPGEKKPSKKVSFVKKCTVDGQDMVLGCGVYDINPDELK